SSSGPAVEADGRTIFRLQLSQVTQWEGGCRRERSDGHPRPKSVRLQPVRTVPVLEPVLASGRQQAGRLHDRARPTAVRLLAFVQLPTGLRLWPNDAPLSYGQRRSFLPADSDRARQI